MKVFKLSEHGYKEALLGTSLSRSQPPENMVSVCRALAHKDGGHNKFLEFMVVWIDITAPRYWWQQMATYRIGSSFLSESTMYTIMKRLLTIKDFEDEEIHPDILRALNNLILDKLFPEVKSNLPEGFLQRRIMVTNYKSLRNIINQRMFHKLPQWHSFCQEILKQIEHPEFIIQNLN